MAWRPDSPITLPDGRLVCGRHRLVICGYCTVDYSFMDEILADDDAETSDYNDSTDNDIDNSNGNVIALRTERRVGTGRVFPTKFNPPNPNDTPMSLFPLGRTDRAVPPVDRFIRRNGENDQFLIYTDGACLENGGQNPRAGCCFVYGSPHGYARFPLEKQGPTGIPGPQTSNRAELRAVIAATRYRYWVGEGCRCLVIATDSEYVVEGMTKWVQGWIRNGWRTSTRVPVKNKDLWQCLLGEVERWDEEGMRIQFWRIPREWNTEADEHAKVAANEGAPQSFGDICGFLV
ncbi:hypothetical protein N7465_006921 [Penicillium sp. CMV-2018d]|nr:hypothetical protein N7465_006921 [Penicillium sp. CMV-2018d]